MLVKWLRLPVACCRLCLRELAAEENWMLASKSVGYRRLLLLFFFSLWLSWVLSARNYLSNNAKYYLA